MELDRRLIRSRIQFLKRQLKAIENSRQQQGKKRQKKSVTAALVGYTNAGKSSLLNQLCQVQIQAEDKLFATLDSTYRMLNPDSKPPMILIDTVGFIQNLPPTLVNGFKTTLESAMEAELLLVVCDISDPHFEKHLQVTEQVLNELNLRPQRPVFYLYQKGPASTDQLPFQIIRKKYPHGYLVSTHDKEQDIATLKDAILELLFAAATTPMNSSSPMERGRPIPKFLLSPILWPASTTKRAFSTRLEPRILSSIPWDCSTSKPGRKTLVTNPCSKNAKNKSSQQQCNGH